MFLELLGLSAGDMKAFKNDFAFIICTKTFVAQTRIRSHYFSAFQKGVSNPLGLSTQNSFAFIICKNHPQSRLETLILHKKSDDKRTP